MNATTTPTTNISLRARSGELKWPSKIYQAIATPVNFITFLVSLYLVDSRNRAQRYRQPERKIRDSSDRTWLSRLLYEQNSSPYEWVDNYQTSSSSQSTHAFPHRNVRDKHAESPKEAKNWFYHTKQKKLLRAEAANAFAVRDSVLFALGTLAIFLLWVLWQTVKWLTGWVLQRIILAKVQIRS
ncbi:hypothetical protein F5B22DRAFT_405227 [Xylaria bambusicola]|uniref:uncharacterized protein n=1 Tax=Xylaria bambusicola TaxID=326684 RepID=UPI002008D95B|nr:uncharacterized protein F5B22DRAFT_405227 [Xylaria bambusicola]KAI0508417.1 hypothetical protein F5B22DRAFT_405227 [Xylaria bambusicola]